MYTYNVRSRSTEQTWEGNFTNIPENVFNELNNRPRIVSEGFLRLLQYAEGTVDQEGKNSPLKEVELRLKASNEKLKNLKEELDKLEQKKQNKSTINKIKSKFKLFYIYIKYLSGNELSEKEEKKRLKGTLNNRIRTKNSQIHEERWKRNSQISYDKRILVKTIPLLMPKLIVKKTSIKSTLKQLRKKVSEGETSTNIIVMEKRLKTVKDTINFVNKHIPTPYTDDPIH